MIVIDHRSYADNLSSCEIKAKKLRPIQPMPSEIPLQCYTNRAINPGGSWPLCKFVIYQEKMRLVGVHPPYRITDLGQVTFSYICLLFVN